MNKAQAWTQGASKQQAEIDALHAAAPALLAQLASRMLVIPARHIDREVSACSTSGDGTAEHNIVQGGLHNRVQVDAFAFQTALRDFTFNNADGFVTDYGTGSRISNLRDQLTGTTIN